MAQAEQHQVTQQSLQGSSLRPPYLLRMDLAGIKQSFGISIRDHAAPMLEQQQNHTLQWLKEEAPAVKCMCPNSDCTVISINNSSKQVRSLDFRWQACASFCQRRGGHAANVPLSHEVR